MIKKLSLLAMVVGAVAAFAAPGVANAAKLTMPANTLVPKGTTITGTSTNTVTETTLGKITCKEVMVSGNVEKNTGTEVEVKTDATAGANTATGCEIVGLGAVTIDPTLTNITASGAGPGTAAFTFNVTGICEAKSTTSEVTWFGTNKLHITAGVAECGTGGLTGDFTLETKEGGGEVIAET
ncbi:MAG: hypothetical protein JST08_21895 [Actinobacteria bacterium]|nr:hypothetical protein [Actinomycetota bacterium]